MINEVSYYFFRSMQLASFLSGLFMIFVAISEILSSRRSNLVSHPRWYFSFLAGTLGVGSVLAFLPRILDSLVFWFNPPITHVGPTAVTALLFFYITSGGLFAIVSGRPRRSLTIFLLVLSSSLMSTYLEFV